MNTELFTPIIEEDGSLGKGTLDVTLSPGLSMVIDKVKDRAQFHFGGLYEEVLLGSKFEPTKDKLVNTLTDISLGLNNLKDLILQDQIFVPSRTELKTPTRFLARFFKDLPGYEILIELSYLDRPVEVIKLKESELDDYLSKLPPGAEYGIKYACTIDVSNSLDKGSELIKLIDTVLLPKIEGMIKRISK